MVLHRVLGFLVILSYLSDACEQNGVNCGSTWVKVLETNTDGNIVSGSKADLRHAVLAGAKVRMLFGSYTTDAQSASASGSEVCVEALFHISKNGWNQFQNSAYWWFLNMCTTGNVHMSRWYVGSHSQPSPPETKTKYNITWFVRHLSSDSNIQSPIYCNANDGGLNCGDIGHLVRAIQNGGSVHVVDPSSGFSAEFSNIAHSPDGSKVAGSHLWSVSQSSVGNYKEFQKDAYWWFTIWSTSGSRDMSRWSVGEHTDRGHTSDKLLMHWFVDPCWTLAYENDENGLEVDGSFNLLHSAVLAGKRVRIVYGQYAIEADYLEVSSTQVTAQVLGHVSKASLETFQSNAYWYWQHYATTGRIETIRYSVGSNVNRGNSNGKGRIKWYIDSRPWSHVYSHSTTGSPRHGSKANLVKDVKEGKMVRFVVRYEPNPSTVFAVYNADNVAISPDGIDIAAEHIRSISISLNSATNDITFQPNPYWYFVLATSNGIIDRTRWTVGSHEARGHNSIKADIDWFTS